MVAKRSDILQNNLLAALPEVEIVRIEPELELVDLVLGQVLYESGKRMTHVYFATIAIISLLYTMENGGTAEIGVAGNNGLVGIALFMGGETTSSRAIVQSAGQSLRIKADHMLGVRREGVTQAAGHLQNLGMIKYSRGPVHILNRKGLEHICCECYEVVATEYSRLLGEHTHNAAG